MFHNRGIFESETRKAQNVSTTLKRFAAYFGRYWPGVVLVLIFVLVSAWATVVAPELIGQAVDCYLFPNPLTPDACWYSDIEANAPNADRLAGLGWLAVALLGLYLLDSVMVGLSFYMMRWTGQNVLRRLRRDLFRQVHRLSLGYYAKHEAGDVMSRVTNDTDTVQQMFNFALLNFIRAIITIVFIVISMIRLNAPYALISLSIVPAMAITTRYFSAQARKAFRIARKEMGSVNADLQESISGAREVQAFNREAETIAQFERSNEANRAANIRAAVFTSALSPVLEALSFVALALVVVVGGLSALRGTPLLGSTVISLGLMFAFVNYVQRLSHPIQQIAILWTNVQSGIAGGERIFQLLDVQADIIDHPDAKNMPSIKGAVTFNDVCAEYIPGEPVLKNISFEAQPGQIVAIVGPTGAGKTTLINLIPRFYDVTGGAVRIDGYDVRKVTAESLRQQIGIVLQDTFLFSDSVMENIRYGKIDASDQEVIAAANLVAAHEFIERLPEGYNTVLGERGSGLSQGQRQLIAIARVALMNPNILILDEATSSVDTRTERIIQQAFEKLLEGRTSFVIAHRLSTIRSADVVMLLEDGNIVERGTHQELLANRGAYYNLYMSQFREESETSVGQTQA